MKNLIKYILITITLLSLVGCGDYGSTKWRLDNKDLTSEEVDKLYKAITIRDEIAQKNKWAELDGNLWTEMLRYFPEEAKYCKKFKGFEKFVGSNWAQLLSEEPRFEKECEKNRGWELMVPEDWIKLLKNQPAYISKAKELKVFDKFTSKNWRDVISSKDSNLLKECDVRNGWNTLDADDWIFLLKDKIINTNFAEKHNAFDKFTPDNWSPLLISNPEFATVAIKSKVLEKYSKKNLIRLYVLQPKLRNEIFALNKIDINFAKKIEILYNRFGSDGRTLNAEDMLILSSIFPETLELLTERTFSLYGLSDWKKLLKKNPLFKKISEKYAYIVPWKRFNFADWCEILGSNSDLRNTFKHYVKVSELRSDAIFQAIARVGYSSFDRFNFWSQFTTEQYVGLLVDRFDNDVMILSSSDYSKSWARVHSKDRFDNNVKVIISKAKQNGIFQKLTKEQWIVLFKRYLLVNESDMSLLEGGMSLLKEYFSLKTLSLEVIQCIVESNNFAIISEYKLWDKLNAKQWISLLSTDKITDAQISDILSHFESLCVIEKLSEEEVGEFLDIYLKIIKARMRPTKDEVKLLHRKYSSLGDQFRSELKKIQDNKALQAFKEDGFKRIGFSQWDKISKRKWMYYFCGLKKRPDVVYIEISGVKNWNKKDTIDFIEMNLKMPAIVRHTDLININLFDLKEARNIICKLDPNRECKNPFYHSIFYEYKKNAEFSLDDLFYFFVHDEYIYPRAKRVNALLKMLEDSDVRFLERIFNRCLDGDKIEEDEYCRKNISSSIFSLVCTKCKMPYEELCKNSDPTKKCKHEWSFSFKNDVTYKCEKCSTLRISKDRWRLPRSCPSGEGHKWNKL